MSLVRPVTTVLLHVVRNGLDDALHLDSRRALLAPVTHDTVAERFADVEEKLATFLLCVLDVLFIAHQFLDRIDHVRTVVEHRQSVGIEQGGDDFVRTLLSARSQ